VQARISKTMEPVPLTPSADGNVHFGDAILLYSVQVCFHWLKSNNQN
jgi:hypothetical protein